MAKIHPVRCLSIFLKHCSLYARTSYHSPTDRNAQSAYTAERCERRELGSRGGSAPHAIAKVVISRWLTVEASCMMLLQKSQLDVQRDVLLHLIYIDNAHA